MMKSRKTLCLIAILSFLFNIFSPFTMHVVSANKSSLETVQTASLEEQQNEEKITLLQLALAEGKAPHTLQSPIDSLSFQFSMPPEWQIESSSKLELSLTSFIASMMPSQGDINYEQIIGGTLTVLVNDRLVETIPIQGVGKKTFTIQIPENSWNSEPEQFLNTLQFQWDASISCGFDLTASISIDPNSSLTIAHNPRELDMDISQFPFPFIAENALFPHPISIIIPDHPTALQLQSAFTAASGLGRLSKGMAILELTTTQEITTQQLNENHLILIGDVFQSPPLVDKLKSLLSHSPNPASGEAILQTITSPWLKARGIISIQAQDDESLLKGAQALSSGNLLSSQNKNISIVQQVRIDSQNTAFSEDKTFADLGIKDRIISQFASNTMQIPLDIPDEIKIGAEAYLDLVFNHSQVADYLRSAVVVRLNNTPIGSVRFSDSTAGLSTLRAMLPSTIIRTGRNMLEIQVDLYPRQMCSDERLKNLWVTIFSNSFLHLPIVRETSPTPIIPMLGDFPSPFVNSPSLNQTLFVIAPENRTAWQAAFQLSYMLGSQTNGDISLPSVLFADTQNTETYAGKHIIALGLPNELPQWQTTLPAVFDKNNDLSENIKQRIQFQPSKEEPIGYLSAGQMDSQRILLISGNANEGLISALNTLLDTNTKEKLTQGNLALIQRKKVIVENIQPNSIQTEEGQIEEFSPEGETIPSLNKESEVTSIPYNQPDAWLLPTIIASISLILLIVGIKIFYTFFATRKK